MSPELMTSGRGKGEIQIVIKDYDNDYEKEPRKLLGPPALDLHSEGQEIPRVTQALGSPLFGW